MNASLSALTIGTLTLDPAFDPDVDEYEVETSNASNKVTVTAADEDAEIEILLGDTEIDNGSSPDWETGENTLTIKVTASDEFATETKTYTVKVTKTELEPEG